MYESWYEKNVMELARDEYLSGRPEFHVYWFDINGVRYSSEKDGRFISEDGDEFDYFREFDGEGYATWLQYEIDPEDVVFLQSYGRTASLPSDLEAVFNGGKKESDYRTVKSLDILYDGEV